MAGETGVCPGYGPRITAEAVACAGKARPAPDDGPGNTSLGQGGGPLANSLAVLSDRRHGQSLGILDALLEHIRLLAKGLLLKLTQTRHAALLPLYL